MFGVGDHHRVGRVFEDGGGQPQLVGSVPLFCDVLKDPDAAALRLGRIKRATAQQRPEGRSVAALQAQLFLVTAACRGDGLVGTGADFDELLFGNVEDAR